MTVLWIIAAIVLLLLLFGWLSPPQQGSTASNAPKRIRPDALPSGVNPHLAGDMDTTADVAATDGVDHRFSGTTDDIAAQSLEAEVAQLLASGQKIAAIKRVRAVRPWGLRQSKDYVEALERREVPPIPKPRTTLVATLELRQEVLRLLTAQQKLFAIKWVMEQTACSLHEAKQYVEAIQQEKLQGKSMAMPPDWPDPALWEEVQELLVANQTFEAVERIRAVTGWELRQALEYVTAVQQSRYQ